MMGVIIFQKHYPSIIGLLKSIRRIKKGDHKGSPEKNLDIFHHYTYGERHDKVKPTNIRFQSRHLVVALLQQEVSRPDLFSF